MRLSSVLLAVLLSAAPAALPAAPAAAGDEASVEVAAAVRTADGGLEVQTRTAPSAQAGEALADRWDDQRGVVAADVSHEVHATSLSADPGRAAQWGLTTLRAEQAWATTTGQGVLVAVVDTGVQGDHPDLLGQVRPPVDLLGAAGPVAVDPNGHGTHVAGIIAALAGNGVGGAGLAPGAQVLSVRALDATGSGRTSVIARGVIAAVDAGAKVVSLSLGGDTRDPVLSSAVAYAEQRGAVVVAAAGNSGPGQPLEWPAADPGVIGVGATDRTDALASFSSTGSDVDLVAPGVGVLSTVPGSGYAYLDGTSMATPFVSAAAALLLSAGVPASAVQARLEAGAVDLGDPGRDDRYGAGRLDVVNALAALAPPVAASPAPSVPAPVAAAPVAPAPVGAPAPPASSVPEPVVVPVPVPASSEPAPAPAPTPTPTPTPTLAPTPSPTPAPTVALAASAARVVAGRPVVLSASVRTAGRAAAGVGVALDRRTATGWAQVGTAVSDRAGRASWTVVPALGTDYRARAASASSSVVRVEVVQRLAARVARTGSSGTVAPAGRATVLLQRRTAAGWVTTARAATTATGSFRLAVRLGPGALVRLVVAPRPGLIGTTGAATAVR